MKAECRTILSLYLLSITFCSHAQSWKCIYPERQAFYINSSEQVRAVRIDSVRTEGYDTIYYNYYNFHEINEYCYSPYYTSWLGKKIIIRPDGYNIFINRFNDTVSIKTDAALNESWMCYKNNLTGSIEAKVISYDTISFLGIIDSIKTINFQAENLSGQPIEHPVNMLSIIISKSYGLLRTLNFNSFPDITFYTSIFDKEPEEYNLIGLTNPDVGVRNLTWMEVNDYNEGDEFHYIYTENFQELIDPYSIRDEYEIIKTMKKILGRSDKGDTVCYQVRIICQETKSLNGITIKDTVYTTISESCYYPDERFNHLPDEPVFKNESEGYEFQLFGTGRQRKLDFSTGCIRFEKAYDSCWRMPVCDGCYIDAEVYQKGLGLTNYECEGGLSNYMKENFDLVYYKKADSVWGEPLILSAGSEFEDFRIGYVRVYPNPFRDEINIKANAGLLITSVKLFTIQGKLVFQVEPINQADYLARIPGLLPGIYFYKILLKDGCSAKGKLIRE